MKLSPLLALCVLGCEAAPLEPPHQAASFVLEVDPATGAARVVSVGVSGAGLHEARPVVQDGVPGNPSPGSWELETTSATLPGEPGCAPTENCFALTVRNAELETSLETLIRFDDITPPAGRGLVGSDGPPAGSGLAEAFGIRQLGTVGAGQTIEGVDVRITIPDLTPYRVHGSLWRRSDPALVCEPEVTVRACYDGPAPNRGVGVCVEGRETCNDTGSGFGACVGSGLPGAEVCLDGLDNDCDGFVDEGCIGDLVWDDRNRDGLQQVSELGVEGVTLLLRSATSGALVQVSVTDGAGHYAFANVPAGSYFAEILVPGSRALTALDVGGDDALDSDFDPDASATAVFTMPTNGTITGLDAGLFDAVR